jgi:hypothetical protein
MGGMYVNGIVLGAATKNEKIKFLFFSKER